jgi:hypothetical protein
VSATASRPAPTAPPPIRPATPPAPKAAAKKPAPALLALTVVFFITTLIFGWMAFAPGSAPVKTPASRAAVSVGVEEEIQNVASRFTENLLTYKAASVDNDIERAKKDATAEFATRQIPAFGNKTLATVASEIKDKNATSSINVEGVVITSRDDSTATALVVGERTIDSDERKSPASQLQVVELTMLNTDGDWKVENASPVTSN